MLWVIGIIVILGFAIAMLSKTHSAIENSMVIATFSILTLFILTLIHSAFK